jgi:hypothetical protein
MNFRKEFFRIDLDSIRKIVESQPGDIKILEFQVEPEAEAYRQSLIVSDEDSEFMENTMMAVAGNEDGFSDEE